MDTLNKAQIIGRVGKAPDINYSRNGLAVCKFSVATDRKAKSPDGKWEEATDWHNVQAWDKTAETAYRRLKPGSCCYVEGRIQTDKYVDKEGVTRWTTKIIASSVKFLDRQEKSESMPQSERQGSQSQATGQKRQPQQGREDWNDQGGFDENNEDLPF